MSKKSNSERTVSRYKAFLELLQFKLDLTTEIFLIRCWNKTSSHKSVCMNAKKCMILYVLFTSHVVNDSYLPGAAHLHGSQPSQS